MTSSTTCGASCPRYDLAAEDVDRRGQSFDRPTIHEAGIMFAAARAYALARTAGVFSIHAAIRAWIAYW